MKVEYKDVDKLIPYEWNNKIHDDFQINRIANSIKEFWFTQPVVIDKNNIIVVWHWRVEWAKKLGLKQVPVVRVENLTDEQIKKYRILDNKLNESDYNLANLKLELDSLEDFNFGDIEAKVDDIFPEMKSVEFNLDDYNPDESLLDDWEKENEKKVKVVISFDTVDEANIAKEQLQDLGYTDLFIKL